MARSFLLFACVVAGTGACSLLAGDLPSGLSDPGIGMDARDVTDAIASGDSALEASVDAGNPFQVAFNRYGAASNPWAGGYDCGATNVHGVQHGVYLDFLMSTLASAGVRVVRFFAFPNYPVADILRVVDKAGAHGLKVIPVLENHWQACSSKAGGTANADDAWYTTGYKTTFLAHAGNIAAQLKDPARAPHIYGVEIMNEMTGVHGATHAHMKAFVADITSVVRAAGWTGRLSPGAYDTDQPGSSGDEFGALHEVPGIDWMTVHDYNAIATPLTARMQTALAQSQRVGRPLAVTEAGATSVAGDRGARATMLQNKLNAYKGIGLELGAIWHAGTIPNEYETDINAFDVWFISGPGGVPKDPFVPLIAGF